MPRTQNIYRAPIIVKFYNLHESFAWDSFAGYESIATYTSLFYEANDFFTLQAVISFKTNSEAV